jgi:transcriptional regulator with XRE-family HTH domain
MVTNPGPTPRIHRFDQPPPVGPRELARRGRELRTWIGHQILELRLEANLSQAALARCAGIDPAHLHRIESGKAWASPDVLIAIGACLGADLSVRYFPGNGPRLHDRFQAPMIEALIRETGPAWRAQPEVAVPAARGVIDLVLRRAVDRQVVACECHSELRRLEIVLRRLGEKADVLGGQLDQEQGASRLLLLRSTEATRTIAKAYEATLSTAFPARTAEAIEALRGEAPWPGNAIVWARVERGRAAILDGSPRSVRVGR